MAANIYDWNVVAANNATADGDLTWAEGQAPSTVNNSARVMMQRGKQLLVDLGGSLSAGGTANALTLTAQSPFSALADGRIVSFRATAKNTGAATLNVNAIGAKAIMWPSELGPVALSGGEIQNTSIYTAQYSAALNGGAGAWLLLNPTIPIGKRFLETGSVSAVALKTFDLTTYIANGYGHFELELIGWRPVTDATALRMTISTDSGSSFLSTSYSFAVANGPQGSAVSSIGAINTSSFGFSSTQGNLTGEVANFTIDLSPRSARFYFSSIGMYWGDDGNINTATASGQNLVAGVNAVKFAYTSGNISVGDYTLWGSRSSSS